MQHDSKVTNLRIFGREFLIWFDQINRQWIAQEVDGFDTQIGTVDTAHSRDYAIVYAAMKASRPRA